LIPEHAGKYSNNTNAKNRYMIQRLLYLVIMKIQAINNTPE